MRKVIFCISLVLNIFSIQAQKVVKPNIVVLMADDIGLGDISFYHKQSSKTAPAVMTPNIDKLISEGMRFSDAHSPASLCAPTRFSMMTGNYSYRNQKPYGVWTANADALIDKNNFTTGARIAKKGGYNTAFFGKWGFGGSWIKGEKVDYKKETGGALSYGFDYAVELPEGIQNKPFAFYENREWMKIKSNSVLKEINSVQNGYKFSKKHNDRGGIGDSNWDPTEAGGILVDKTVAYIKKQKGSEKPFFLYYCSQAVHIPHTPPAMLDGNKVAGTTPGVHGDMIYELDIQVGMIIEALKKTGAYENTLFVFTSDNGGLSFDQNMKKAGHDTSYGLNGSKGSIYEGGHRVPFIAVWPGVIQANSISNEPVVGQDMVATIAALSQQKLDISKVFDSANLLPYFKGEKTEKPAHIYLMHQSKGGPTYAIRDGKWKLILKGKKPGVLENLTPIELYDLESNLFEDSSRNLIEDSKHKNRIENMMKTYIDVRVSKVTTVN